MYNLYCLDEQNTGALYLNKAAGSHFSQSNIAGKAPSVCGLTSSAVRLGNGSAHGGRFAMGKYTKIKKNCVICGKEFEATATKTQVCSKHCRYLLDTDNVRISGNCIVCGKEFKTTKRYVNTKRFCSDNCKHKFAYEPAPKKLKLCAYCGKEFAASHGNRKTCDACLEGYKRDAARERDRRYRAAKRAARKPIEPKICANCGNKFVPDLNHIYKIYCSPACQKNVQHVKERGPNGSRTKKERESREQIACGICGYLFTPTKEHHKYCSKECGFEAEELQDKAYRSNNKIEPTKRICKLCGIEFEALGKWKCCCKEHSYLYLYGVEIPKELTKICEWCGEEFATRISRARACPQHANRLNKWERKMRQRTAIHVHYSRFEIFRRDNFTCHICGTPINMKAKAPRGDSPTVDHVIPLVKGGSDTPENVRAAHFYCNSRKSYREI
jgi:hypothetical protein